ncbi:MAG: hypothetical protein ABIH89_01280, partial [Elusimicrobiota bacterium]
LYTMDGAEFCTFHEGGRITDAEGNQIAEFDDNGKILTHTSKRATPEQMREAFKYLFEAMGQEMPEGFLKSPEPENIGNVGTLPEGIDVAVTISVAGETYFVDADLVIYSPSGEAVGTAVVTDGKIEIAVNDKTVVVFQDNKMYDADMTEIGSYDESGNIYDVDGNTIGNIAAVPQNATNGSKIEAKKTITIDNETYFIAAGGDVFTEDGELAGDISVSKKDKEVKIHLTSGELFCTFYLDSGIITDGEGKKVGEFNEKGQLFKNIDMEWD